MSEQNVIPSAPPLYPSLRESAGDYRLKKISDCQKELENEISHYRRISKKYKRTKTIINAFAATTGALTIVLSSASLATLLTQKVYSEINPFSFYSPLIYSSRLGTSYLILIKITLCDLHLRFFIPSLFLWRLKSFKSR